MLGPTQSEVGRTIGSITVGEEPLFSVYDGDDGDLYVTNSLTNNVSIIAVASNSVVGSFPVGTNPNGITYDANLGELFVANWRSESVSVVSTSTDAVVATIPLGFEPWGITDDAQNGQVYVSSFSASEVVAISAASNTVLTTIGVGKSPRGMALDAQDGMLYVTNEADNNVSVINTSDDAAVAGVNVGSGPGGAVWDPQDGEIFVTNGVAGNVSAIATATNRVVANVTVGSYPLGIAYDSANGDLYVVNVDARTVSVVSAVTNTVLETLGAGDNAWGATYVPQNSEVYVQDSGPDNVTVISTALALGAAGASLRGVNSTGVPTAQLRAEGEVFYEPCNNPEGEVFTDGPDNVSIVSGATNTVVAVLPVGSSPGLMACDTTNGDVYVPIGGTNNVSVISEATDSVVATVPGGNDPFAAAFDSANGDVYVANLNAGTVSVISGASNTVVATVSVGTSPIRAVYDSDNGEVYVLNLGSSTLSAIGGVSNTVVSTIPVGSNAQALAYDPENGGLYVGGYDTSESTYTVTVVSGATDSVVANPAVGSEPDTILYDPATDNIYTFNVGASTSSVLSGLTNSVIATLPAGLDPQGATLDTLNGDFYVPDGFSDQVGILDPASGSLLGSINLGPGDTEFPYDAALDPANGYVYVSESYTDRLAVVSTLARGAPAVTATLDIGQTLTFSAPVMAVGAGVANYTVAVLPNASLACTADSFGFASIGGICSATAPGTYSVNLTVEDALGNRTFTTLTVQVYWPPSAGAVRPSPASGADLGQPTTFQTAGLNGTGSYPSFNWEVPTGLNCTPTLGALLSCDPNSMGSYSVSVNVTDSNNVTSANVTLEWFNVSADPTVQPPTATNRSLDIGQETTLSTSATNGTGLPSSYSWAPLPTGCPTVNALSLVCSPQGAGVFEVRATVTDSNGFRVTSAPVELTISQDPTILLAGISNFTFDVGQPTTLTASATNGTGLPSIYAWSGLPFGCASADVLVLTCVPTRVGGSTFAVSVNITDSNGFVARTPAVILKVYADPTISAPIESRTALDVGQTLNFSATATNSTGGRSTYAWTSLPGALGCPASTALNLACVPTAAFAGTVTVGVAIRDSNGFQVSNSSTVSLTVSADLSVGPIQARNATLDLGQSTQIDVDATNHTGLPVTFVWSGLPTGCPNVDVSNFTCTPSATGTFKVGVNVTDSNGFEVSEPHNLTLKVSQALTNLSLRASRTSLDLGQSTKLTGRPSGGLGPYSYAWLGLPPGCSTTDSYSLTCTPTAVGAGTFSVQEVVNDSNGASLTSPVLALTVNPDPTISFTASTTTLDVGQRLFLNATVTLGTNLTATYTWQGLPTGCQAANATRLACVPTAPGNFSVWVYLTDANGVYASSGTPLLIHVSPLLSLASVVLSASSIDLNMVVSINPQVSGGSGNYSYAWSGVPADCVLQSGGGWICAPTNPSSEGVYHLEVTVTDSDGGMVTSSVANLTIVGDPTLSVPSASRTRMDVGQSTLLGAVATNDTGLPSIYAWAGLPAGCLSMNALSLRCGPTIAGEFNISVSIRDSNGYNVSSGPLTLIIDPALSSTLTSSRTTLDILQSVSFEVGVTGGDPPYSFAWSGLPPGCLAQPGVTYIPCRPSAIGSFTVEVWVNDTNLESSFASVTLVISADPTVSVPSASRSTLDLGQWTTLTVISTNGTGGPVIYAWYGLPTGCASLNRSTVVCLPSVAGQDAVYVTVEDSNGFAVTSPQLTLNVSPALGGVTLGASPNPVSAGSTLTILVAITGGSGPYQLAWSGLSPLCKSWPTVTSSGPAFTCQPSRNGTFEVRLAVTDQAGEQSVAYLNLTVTAAPPAPRGLTTVDWVALLAGVAFLILLGLWLMVGRRRREVEGKSPRPGLAPGPQVAAPPSVESHLEPPQKPVYDEDDED